MFALEVAHAAGGHDRLVVAAVLAVVLELEGAEHAAKLWTAKFIAKGGAADGTFEHDVHRGGHALRVLGDRLFPWLGVAGHFEVGNHECGEASLRAAADTGGAFVADFTADTGRCAREGRDCGRVVVGLDLAKDVELGGGLLIGEAAVLLVDFPPVAGKACEHAGVIGVGDQHAIGIEGVGVADHFEQGAFALFAVDDPVGIENLVAAVLGVDLREHDELGIGRVALHLLVGLDQVVDLLIGHREAPVDVGLGKGFRALGHEWHGAQGCGLEVAEEVGDVVVDGLGHAVVQGEEREAEVFDAEHEALGGGEAEVDAALDAGHGAQGAVVENVGRLGGPGGNGALARSDEEAPLALEMVVSAEEREGARGSLVVERAFSLDEIYFDSVDFGDVVRVNRFVERVFKRLEAEIGKCGKALENDRLHS